MTNTLRDLVGPGRLASVMSAHNPLSARLAELAGFDGIWASGFELSAAYGVPDASLLSFIQHLDMTRAIVERVSAPVVADLDTAYGNAVNVMHVVGAHASAGGAAVVIEDKTFPKDTSLLAGGRQDLVRVEEFQGKIAAALTAGTQRDLLVVARTEALIADLGIDEALRRASAYTEAGADMILLHSKQKTPAEIVAFSRRWQGRTRLVVVPTAYPDLTEARIRDLRNIGMVIYGNHAVRAAVTAMRQVFGEVRANGGIHNVG
jgi:phosphoenolpyruvate phosphomutase